MIKNIFAIILLMLTIQGCTATSAKAEKNNGNKQTKAISANKTQSDTTIMPTENLPEGSVKVLVHTTAGDFTIALYGDTPGHRDNFLKNLNNGVYNGVLFHRVIKDFMVQTGDPESKGASSDALLGAGDAGEPIPAEIVFPKHYHKRGALAAARQGDQVNPQRKSSASQFYVVTGRKFSDDQLAQMDRRLTYSVGQNYFDKLVRDHLDEIRRMQSDGDNEGLNRLQQDLSQQTNQWLEQNPVAMTQEMRNAYTSIGGTPHLDNEYTVFGEVLSGMDTIDRIQNSPTGANDRPVDDIRITSMEVIK